MRPPASAWRIALLTLLGAGLLAAAGAAAVVWSGWYDVAANRQHTQPVYDLLETAMHQAVQRRARDIAPPAGYDAPARVERGALCYRDNCLQCHGAPGRAPDDIGRSMQPLPGPLIDAGDRWSAGELYWLTRNGIKMSGMPAWQYRLAEDDLWALVAFLERLPALPVTDYRALMARQEGRQCAAPPDDARAAATPGDARRGLTALHQHACNACHVIPGVTGADIHVGPPLAGMARRGLIAGRLPNTAENMVRWLRDPRSVEPGTAMPALGVSEQDARDMAAYLATLH